jgi:hypothetical protein
MNGKAKVEQANYNSKSACMGVGVEGLTQVEQLKHQLQELEVQLADAYKLLAELVSPTNAEGRAPQLIYYTETRQEINTLLTKRDRLYFSLGNDHD